jgi:UDP-N-acetylmuramoyl-L-alanyl-D-glutamate--2,6-diaminopimelate ligase
MGRAVARDADLPIVTSDNPRTEDPLAIINMVVEGVREVRPGGFLVEVDRRRAIAAAVAAAGPGDIVLIAGKGHEDYQIIGKVKHHFDDREEAAEALAKLANRTPSGQS